MNKRKIFVVWLAALPALVMFVYSCAQVIKTFDHGNVYAIAVVFVATTFVAAVAATSFGKKSLFIFTGVVLIVASAIAMAYIGWTAWSHSIYAALGIWGGLPALAAVMAYPYDDIHATNQERLTHDIDEMDHTEEEAGSEGDVVPISASDDNK